MQKFLFSFFFLVFTLSLKSQAPYWQQQVNYKIDVSLNDTAHSLNGFETIEYFNNSPDTLKYIWFHVWPNAYKNDKTAFSDQLLESGKTNFYFSSPEQRGYINRLDFRVNNTTATVEDHPQHIDIIKLVLPSALPPNQKIIITTPFHVKLPFNFSRGGHVGQSYQVTQWYPKPAVYDKNGWHPMSYVDQGEFYSEFGNFEVNITLPSNYVVAATGELQDAAKEKQWLLTRGSTNQELDRLRKNQIPASASETKTLKFRQDRVHDFAWFADKSFIVDSDTVTLNSGKQVDVYSYYTTAGKTSWRNAVKYAKAAVTHYSSLVGEYPYKTVSVVAGPESFGGGMEYPTITVISPIENDKLLEQIIVHEVGHNWFYGILASNERDHPWMDEGMNSFYEKKYLFSKYGERSKFERIAFETKAITKTDQPINLHSEKYSLLNYGISVYDKTAEWMQYLEKELGTETFNKGMQQYFDKWKFRHPQPGDFRQSLEISSGRNLDNEFSLLSKTGILPHQQRKGTSFATVFNVRKFDRYLKHPTKDFITAGPAFGLNSYDKLMVGLFATNLKLPPSKFNFFLAPLYATGSKKLNAIGFTTYSFYPNNLFKSIDVGVSGSRFSSNEFADNNGKKTYFGFSKIVPGIKFTFKEKEARSPFHRFIQFKSFFIGEDELRFSRDTIINGIDTSIIDNYRIDKTNRTLQQLRFVIENNRALYPFRGELKLEAGKEFVRAAFTGNYFFNYAKGGLNVRTFAGKFFYTGSRTATNNFTTERYHLNLSGPNGYEDYTYSDYFTGRNRFQGWQSQQMMIKEGAFKVRTDLLAEKIGRTDDWLAAVNFTSSIPDKINPFMLLPLKIPVKVFLDIGTYAETWRQEAETDRFLYDAGLYLPLFKETINIYIPLIYSSVYGDYFKSTAAKKDRFWKKISFSIDISNFSFRKIDRNLSL